MPNRIEELFAELAESAGGQQQFQIDQQLQQMEAQRQLHDTPEARRALEIAGILGLVALPIPGSNTLAARLGLGKLASKVPGAEKLYGQVGQDFTKFIEPLKSKLSGVFGRSGSGVGADVVGRVPLPKIKDPVVTKRGPRGPTNIDSPNQMPLPLSGGRNTGGISDAERAQLPSSGIPSTTTGKSTKSYMDNVRQTKLTEQQTNRRNFIQQEIFKLESMRRQGEATQANMDKLFKLQKELEALNKLLN